MSEITKENRIHPQGTGRRNIPFGEAFQVWLKIALLSFGGPAGQIAVMHRLLVEEKKWLSEARFLHALNFCMLLPGPEAQQLTIYIGWLTHRVIGGVVAGILFVLPGALAMMALSWIYVLYSDQGIVAGLFFGLKAAVLAIVLQAVVKIGQKALFSRLLYIVSAFSFVGIFFLGLPFPVIIFMAALFGFIAGKQGWIDRGNMETDQHLEEIPLRRSEGSSLLMLASCLLLLWLGPVFGIGFFLGPDSVYGDIAGFFSKMAVVTFGGAYAVLSYVAQAAVGDFGWLQPGEMLDGLGMAETTPGPLIMVTQFVGFMGAYRDPGTLSPLLAGTLGGLLTTWVTFAPCFLWIFLGAPYVERLRENEALRDALTVITAAVAGVILNLAIWFGLHVLFRELTVETFGFLHLNVPTWSSFDILSAGLSVLALIAVFRFKMGMLPLIGAAALAGMALAVFGTF
ncbi:MAG: chromate efflux transporter [Sneathiellales bacterium]|nr:chromate efflux transporter [Sneathiellales bacterium]